MAKIDKSTIKTGKKAKGIKRKHEANDDDGVASKSLILSQEPSESFKKKKNPKKLKKHANNSTEKKSEFTNKPIKRKASSSDEDMIEPTLEQLLESEKPENVKSIVTIRQKKKQKHQQRLEAQKDQVSNKEVIRNQEYLQKWKNNRDNWKFEKLRQISIQQSVFDDTKVSAEIWPIALEYLSGSQGTAKEKIKKLAEAVIDELDKEIEESADADSTLITSSEKYRRARELLQSFD